MNVVIIILSILVGIIALLLVIAAFMKKAYRTHSEIIINASRENIFEYIKHIKNQDHFNKWLMIDPAMKKEYKGADGTIGFTYAWNGNKEAGEGVQEITSISEGNNIEMELRFARPISGKTHANMTTESLPGTETKVTWNTSGEMKYPVNLMLPMIVKMLEKDMGISLATLKNILER